MSSSKLNLGSVKHIKLIVRSLCHLENKKEWTVAEQLKEGKL